MTPVKRSSNPLEVAIWVNGLHGGLAQGESLCSKVHDGVAVVGNSIIFAFIADVIGELKAILNVLLQHLHVPVPVSPLLCVHHTKHMEQLVEQTTPALIDTSLTVSKLVIALQNNLGLVWRNSSHSGAERGNFPRTSKASCLRSLHLQVVA